MAKVELKKPVVEEIANSIKGAAAVVLVNYKGISVEQDTQMRKELREAGVVYIIICHFQSILDIIFVCSVKYRRCNVKA